MERRLILQSSSLVDRFEYPRRGDGIKRIVDNRQEMHVEVGQTERGVVMLPVTVDVPGFVRCQRRYTIAE